MNAVAKALFDRLTSDATLTDTLGVTGVWEQVVPQTTPAQQFPYVLMSLGDSTDDYTLGRRWRTGEFWLVKAVDQDDSSKRAGQVADRIDELLTLQPLTVTGLGTLIVRREQSFAYPENDAGLVYRHAGGRYRVEVSA